MIKTAFLDYFASTITEQVHTQKLSLNLSRLARSACPDSNSGPVLSESTTVCVSRPALVFGLGLVFSWFLTGQMRVFNTADINHPLNQTGMFSQGHWDRATVDCPSVCSFVVQLLQHWSLIETNKIKKLHFLSADTIGGISAESPLINAWALIYA